MSRDTWNIDYGPLRGFYRDRENGWIFGVCAGVADRFNFNVSTVRVIAVISLLLFFWLTAAIYISLTVLFASGFNSKATWGVTVKSSPP